MLDYDQLAPLLRDRSFVDAPCPECSPYRRADHRRLKVLRVWRMAEGMVSFHCAHCEESGYAWDGVRRSKAPSAEEKRAHQVKRDELDQAERERRTAIARSIWDESQSPWNTWVEEYLDERGLVLPEYAEEAIRFHPHCRFPGGISNPAMIVAFTAFVSLLSTDPMPPVAIHRIRGKGHRNKFMLGPVAGAAMMLTPPTMIGDELGVCEGVETGLAVMARFGVPVWALGSAGAIERFPLIKRIKRLTVWADNDKSGTGVRAAQVLGDRYAAAGREVTVRWPEEAGDYAG